MATDDAATVHLTCKSVAEVPEHVLLKCDDIRILKLSQVTGCNGSDFLRTFTNVQKLILDQCDLLEVPDEIWKHMQIKELDVSHSELDKVLIGHIGHLSRLTTLKWCGPTPSTSTSEDDEDLLASGRGLELVCYYSPPKYYDEDVYETLYEYLPDRYLTNSRLHPLNSSFVHASDRRHLLHSIGDLQMLEELDLSQHDFSAGLSTTIGQLRRLTKLRLNACKLQHIPDSLGDLISLVDLDLSCNNFSRGLNPTIGRLHQLRKLNLGTCNLRGLPDSLGDLETLEELNLRRNYLSNRLTSVLERLRRLKILQLEYNTLHSLPDSIGDLELLEELNLSHNLSIVELNHTFGKLRRLKKLQLCASSVCRLPDSFGDLESLEELDLSCNNFSNGINKTFGQLRRLKILNLKSCQLTSLPDSFAELQSLEVLNLSANKFELSGLKPNFGRLRRLINLDLHFSGLGALPDSFGDLALLEVLDLGDNTFSKGLCQTIGRLRRLKKLRLDNCKLARLPDSLGELALLEELRLSYNSFHQSLNPVIGRLRRLKKLTLRACKLKELPDSFGDLTLLEELDLSENAFFENLSPTIGRLRLLRELNLHACELRSLPDAFGDLEALENLNLSRNVFSKGLNPAIGRLSRLAKIDLHDCNLRSLPDAFGDLKALKEVNLSKNAFSNGLNAAFRQLRRLTTLTLRTRYLPSLRDSFGDLQLLEQLDLSDNDFSEGLNITIGKLWRLKVLSLRATRLRTIPDSLGDLQLLEVLDLSGNEFSKGLNPTIGRLHQLKILNLSDSRLRRIPESLNRLNAPLRMDGLHNRSRNHIEHLPVELAYTNLHSLSLDGNPITDPPKKIWQKGLFEIKRFMREIIPGGELMFADTVNVIGNTGSGKTSLAQSLVAGAPRPTREADRTRVMHQLRMTVDKSAKQSVNINDFGGHEIYHSVLPIFLPSSGLLILTYDMSAEDQEQAVKKWLLTAIAKSGEFQIIIVGTRADKIADEGRRLTMERSMFRLAAEVLQIAITDVNDRINSLRSRAESAAIQRKLNTLCEVKSSLLAVKVSTATVSCATPDERLTHLRDLIVKMLKPPISMPIRWCKVVKSIFIANPDGLFITITHVKDICKAHLTEKEVDGAMTMILRYLSKTSQIIWLDDHPTLRNVIFHSPRKIVNACKSILHHDIQASHFPQNCKTTTEEYENGILREEQFGALLGTYCEESQLYKEQTASNATYFQRADVVADFMKQFNLLSYVSRENGGKLFIIPCKLSPVEPSRLQELTKTEVTCLNRVNVRLSFIESIIPMSLFETSLSFLLTIAVSMSENHACQAVWRDGAMMIHDGVHFVAKRRDAVITLTAFSKLSDPSPWTVLHPVLVRLNENIETSWHGAPPHCAIVCPWCERLNIRGDSTTHLGEIKVDLYTLATRDGNFNARPACGVCLNTIPLSLCFPTMISGSYINNQSEICKFFEENERKSQESTKGQISKLHEPYCQSNQAKLQVNWAVASFEDVSESMQASHCKLVERLSHLEVKDILYNKGILLPSEKEEVEALTTRSKACNYLCDAIRKKGTRGCEALVEALWETSQYELYLPHCH